MTRPEYFDTTSFLTYWQYSRLVLHDSETPKWLYGARRDDFREHLRAIFLPEGLVLFGDCAHQGSATSAPRSPQRSSDTPQKLCMTCLADVFQWTLVSALHIVLHSMVVPMLLANLSLGVQLSDTLCEVQNHLLLLIILRFFEVYISIGSIPRVWPSRDISFAIPFLHCVGVALPHLGHGLFYVCKLCASLCGHLNGFFNRDQLIRLLGWNAYRQLGDLPSSVGSFLLFLNDLDNPLGLRSCGYHLPDGETWFNKAETQVENIRNGYLVLRLGQYPDMFTAPWLRWLNRIYLHYRVWQRRKAATQAYRELEEEADRISRYEVNSANSRYPDIRNFYVRIPWDGKVDLKDTGIEKEAGSICIVADPAARLGPDVRRVSRSWDSSESD
ncbi:hypothetical protein B0T19DRAFT_445464 [Cercophora scortea]|uniref:Uncharacterized protein n=1 Tax=Cercophora scortea TaxID=314031 RepID=A0AAE0I7N0_9PEZI|nr:hypothetical protein B0T19DRAFT_445464 [Cercophora scortea]